jgi:hypothetical protein
MSRFKLGAIASLLIGPFILVMNFMETKEKKQIDKDGVETLALPTEKTEKRGRKGRRSYELGVEYPVEGGSTQTAKVDVSKELYDTVGEDSFIKIKYLKEMPSKLIVVGEKIEHPELNYIGAGIFVLGLVGCWWVFLRKKPEALPEPAAGV